METVSDNDVEISCTMLPITHIEGFPITHIEGYP